MASANCGIEWEGEGPESAFRDLAGGFARDAQAVLTVGCVAAEVAAALSAQCRRVLSVEVPHDNRELRGDLFDLVVYHGLRRPLGLANASALAAMMAPESTLVALVPGESHRIETQEVFGRGFAWPPVRPARFALPEALAESGLVTSSFADYYGACFFPGIELFAAELEAVPIIPGFERAKDALFLREVERVLRTDQGLRDTVHACVIVAQKRGVGRIGV